MFLCRSTSADEGGNKLLSKMSRARRFLVRHALLILFALYFAGSTASEDSKSAQ